MAVAANSPFLFGRDLWAETRIPLFEQANQKRVCFVYDHVEFVAIQAKKNVRGEKRDALVSVDEGVIHDEGFKQGCAHFREVFVIPGLRSEQRAIQQAKISNAGLTAESFD